MSEQSKKLAKVRLIRARNKLYKIGAVADDAGALLSVLLGLGSECELLRSIKRATSPIIASLERLIEADSCDLDETMQSILSKKAEGKPRARKGAR